MAKKKIGKYIVNLEDLLGKGSFASVYRGKHSETNEQIAVKVVEKSQSIFYSLTFKSLKINTQKTHSNKRYES